MIGIEIPSFGKHATQATISRWLKKPGDTVKRDESLFEISTRSIDCEISSPASGVLVEILIPEGATVPMRTLVARIREDRV